MADQPTITQSAQKDFSGADKTPCISHSSRSEFGSGEFDSHTSAIRDPDHMEIPANDFSSHYLPSFVSSAVVDACFDDLKTRGDITEAALWTLLEDFDPKKKRENEAFKTLENVFTAIQNAYSSLPGARTEATTQFEYRPSASTASAIQGGSFVSDSILCPEQSSFPPYPASFNVESEEYFSADAVCNGEFKREGRQGDVKDNRQKTVEEATHYMNNDIFRLHMYSFSIEDNEVQLSYCCRSHLVRSTKFSLLTEPKLLIHFVVSLSFGTLEELGYGPVVKPKLDKSGMTFCVYALNKRRFMTSRCLSSCLAACTPGRATGVREVVETDDIGQVIDHEPSVLKDCLLDKDARTDMSIQKDICGKLGASRGSSDKIPTSILANVPNDEQEKVKEALEHFEDSASSARTAFLERAFVPKKHSRLIYSNVCNALPKVTNWGAIVKSLHHSVLALQLLYMIAYMHRDVSVGSILYHSNINQGKLWDFDHAKEFISDSTHAEEPKTGTPAFMAMDVWLGLYVTQFEPTDFDHPLPLASPQIYPRT